MTENPQDVIDYVNTALRTADVAEKAGLFRWLKRWVAREPSDANDWQAEAVEALRLNSLERLRSVALTMEQMLQILEPEFGPEHLRELDPSWENHWISGAGKVAVEDEERREWWARILAGEIQQPGSFSLRTLSVMDVLSTEEARLFSRLAGYVWTGFGRPASAITPKQGSKLWAPNTIERSTLQASGLLVASDLTWSVQIKQGFRFLISQGQTSVALVANDNFSFRFGDCLLTEAGEQLWTLTSPAPDPGYYSELQEEWRQHCEVIQQ